MITWLMNLSGGELVLLAGSLLLILDLTMALFVHQDLSKTATMWIMALVVAVIFLIVFVPFVALYFFPEVSRYGFWLTVYAIQSRGSVNLTRSKMRIRQMEFAKYEFIKYLKDYFLRTDPLSTTSSTLLLRFQELDLDTPAEVVTLLRSLTALEVESLFNTKAPEHPGEIKFIEEFLQFMQQYEMVPLDPPYMGWNSRGRYWEQAHHLLWKHMQKTEFGFQVKQLRFQRFVHAGKKR